ncbi:DUF350 domain-containing protein [Thalassotalea mangrovi]|uniref:DUF350 domain-containing protein n=1 Tax=Thalassotalea mangrovi TaxID=2572245 RepID=A0A4U1B965_9GAMM|nr:DUF350 domain-containing protein [Thalassotalea mangrovi]TKB47193.1 DUF350 domain-containing protein [Thalassotalea mangrovi]
MEYLFSFAPIDPEVLLILVAEIAIAIFLLALMRYCYGLFFATNSTDELAKVDNFAFGISLAGSIAGLGIILTGAITPKYNAGMGSELINMFSYGVLGMILLYLGRFVHDRWSLHLIDKRQQIADKNITVGIVDAASVIATAIIIRAMLLWVEGFNPSAIIAMISAFAVAQTILTLVTRIREHHYAKYNQLDSLQDAFADGQIALALRYSGQLLSTSLAVTSASYFLDYHPDTIVQNLIGWLIFGLLMTLAMWMLTTMAKKLILRGINLEAEVDHQHNVGVASVEMAISIGIALMLTTLLA